jgi:hypothetical protein
VGLGVDAEPVEVARAGHGCGRIALAVGDAAEHAFGPDRLAIGTDQDRRMGHAEPLQRAVRAVPSGGEGEAAPVEDVPELRLLRG